MTIINMTPHSINLINDGTNIVIPPDGRTIRVTSHVSKIGEINNIPIFSTTYDKVVVVMPDGEVVDLPEQNAETRYIVSAIAAQALKKFGRNDILIINDAVRDENGRIIGCRLFAVV